MGNTKDVDVIRLAEDIRQAYLFIQHEQTQLYELNNKVRCFENKSHPCLNVYVLDQLGIAHHIPASLAHKTGTLCV